ncbi:FtsH protease activity modulator HflK [Kangiella sediminilitoris]|uniref:Protein HflK n=1 Tax=Kangiella sediminilitoris TaxID=1144748 RepID=A0A1B3BCY2_9GAMM|nr:FtsH protease activity modulator HflK [Kangiella sediminilitoris]AOE50618.1 HflK protein [Kangiella sediminilitoris]
MAWNEPGNNNQDPWGKKRPNQNNDDLEDLIKKVGDKIGGIFGGGKNSDGGGKNFLVIGIVIFAIFYIVKGFYTVKEAERGVILHFGEYSRTVNPGLGWLPFGIQKIKKVNIDKIREERISAIMLTKDINIIEVDIGIQYQVNKPKDYLFNLENPKTALIQASESALRQVVGNSDVDPILTDGKAKIQAELQALLPEILTSYNSGLLVRTITLESAKPPKEVNDAFEEVNRASQDAKRLEQEADAYRNRELPLAISKAEEIKQLANGYYSQVLGKAKGEVARFEQLLPQYEAAPEITRTRLYIDMMEQVLANTSKVVIDVEGGNNMMYIPLDKIMKNTKGVNNAK